MSMDFVFRSNQNMLVVQKARLLLCCMTQLILAHQVLIMHIMALKLLLGV